MSEIIMKLLIEKLQMTHNLMLKASEEITEEQFAWQPSQTAPPIGWHLWHVARWADRLQASFPVEGAEKDNTPDPNNGIWEIENMASQWGSNTSTLGSSETGAGMDIEIATSLPQIGKDKILGYARRVFASVDNVIDGLGVHQLFTPKPGIIEHKVVDDKLTPASAAESTAAEDFGFHIFHAARHLGMVEALRGVLKLKGSATV
jgi:hypothetical protein